ncbi:hypothetical protein Tco_0733366 [Tanacetum coccineum]
MDWYTNNALWLYWKRGDDEEVLTYDELSNFKEKNVSEENEIYAKNSRSLIIFFKLIYEWNKEVSLSGHVEWPTCNLSEDGYYSGGNLSRMIRVGNMTYFQNYEWYEGLEVGDLKDEALKEKAILEGSLGHENREGKNFFSWLKKSFGNYHKIDYELAIKLEEYCWGKKEEKESSEDAWRNYSPNNDNDAIQGDQERFDNYEPMEDDDDDDIRDLEDYMVP